MSKPITDFIEKYYLHFNAASLVDAAKGYEKQLEGGSKMLKKFSNKKIRFFKKLLNG